MGENKKRKNGWIKKTLIALSILCTFAFLAFVASWVDTIMHPTVLLGGQTISMDYISEGMCVVKNVEESDFFKLIESNLNVIQIGDVTIVKPEDVWFATQKYCNETVEVKYLLNGKILSQDMEINEDVFSIDKVDNKIYTSGKISMYIPSISFALSFAHPVMLGHVEGTVYLSEATGVKKEYGGYVDDERTSEVLGFLNGNDVYGATINYNTSKVDKMNLEKIRIARKNEVKLGKAFLYTDFGEGLNYYEIEIFSLKDDTKADASYYGTLENRGFVPGETKIEKERFLFHMKDERLTKHSNVIIAGMSGSPVVQDGNLIGFAGYSGEEYSVAIYAETAYWDTIKKFWEGELK